LRPKWLQRDDEKPGRQTEPVPPEGRLHIGGLAGTDRHARSQFSEGCCAECHHDGCKKEGERRMHAASAGRNADKNVDASSDGHAQAVEDRKGQSEGSR